MDIEKYGQINYKDYLKIYGTLASGRIRIDGILFFVNESDVLPDLNKVCRELGKWFPHYGWTMEKKAKFIDREDLTCFSIDFDCKFINAYTEKDLLGMIKTIKPLLNPTAIGIIGRGKYEDRIAPDLIEETFYNYLFLPKNFRYTSYYINDMRNDYLNDKFLVVGYKTSNCKKIDDFGDEID